jgi:hypothetical protein
VVTDTRTRLGTIKAIKQSNSKLNIRRSGKMEQHSLRNERIRPRKLQGIHPA